MKQSHPPELKDGHVLFSVFEYAIIVEQYRMLSIKRSGRVC